MEFIITVGLDSSGLCRINRTDSWTVVEFVVSVGLVLGQWQTE